MCEKYKAEREEICKNLIAIVGCEFFLSDLDSDEEKQNTILAMKDDVQKVFAVSAISTFKPCLMNTVRRGYLNIVKNVVKQQGYTFEGKNSFKKINDEGLLQKTIKYKITRVVNF